MRVKVLDVPIDDFSLEDILEKIKNGQRLFQVFVNIHKLVLFHKDKRLSALLDVKNSVFSVDGRWVQFLARLKGFVPKVRFGGQEVINRCFCLAGERGYGIYLLGAERQVLAEAKEAVGRNFPDVRIAGARDGFFENEEEVIEEINNKHPDIVFLALPSPRKELLAHKIFERVQSIKYIAGVGGAFDILAGRKRRAPRWIQNIGLEWLWRVLQEPNRLFMRYFLDGLWLFGLMLRRAFRYD
jgi:N-acetylglucosaminyldiphosphoundecaprenol N-acetyl-beta-D-mannosaminyltransferase